MPENNIGIGGKISHENNVWVLFFSLAIFLRLTIKYEKKMFPLLTWLYVGACVYWIENKSYRILSRKFLYVNYRRSKTFFVIIT